MKDTTTANTANTVSILIQSTEIVKEPTRKTIVGGKYRFTTLCRKQVKIAIVDRSGAAHEVGTFTSSGKEYEGVPEESVIPVENKARKDIKIDPIEVLACLISDANCADGSFQDFCDNLGYDSDSRKALNTFKQCLNTRHVLMRFGVGLEIDEDDRPVGCIAVFTDKAKKIVPMDLV